MYRVLKYLEEMYKVLKYFEVSLSDIFILQ